MTILTTIDSEVFFDLPVNIHELRKTYTDDVEFITDTQNYPNVVGLRYSGQLHKAIKGKLVGKNVKAKVDRLLELYKRRLLSFWDDHLDELSSRIAAVGLAKAEDDETQKKRAIIAGILAGLGFSLADNAMDFYKQAYLIGKDRGLSISGQDFKDALSDEEVQKLANLTSKNQAYIDKFMSDLENKYIDAINKEYATKQAEEDEIKRITAASEARLNLYPYAALGALALGFTVGVKEGASQAQEAAEAAGEEAPDEITGIIWVTQHDENVCPGCADNDGKFFTMDEFEEEYQNNDCLVRCRCGETSQPTTRPADNFARSMKLSTLQKGGPGSGPHPSGKIPVTYIGYQEGFGSVPGFHMVNDPSGSTLAFKPDKHIIVGSKKNLEIPPELMAKGGPGSGCNGPNCGRPSSGTMKVTSKNPDSFVVNPTDPVSTKYKYGNKDVIDKFVVLPNGNFIPVQADQRHSAVIPKTSPWADYDASTRVVQDLPRKIAMIRMSHPDPEVVNNAIMGDERATNQVLEHQKAIADKLYAKHKGMKVILGSGGTWRFHENNLPKDLDNGRDLPDKPQDYVQPRFIYKI